MANKFARAGGGNWSTDATWSTTTGGGADTTKPVAGDNAYLDANSGQVTVDAVSACAVLDCSNYTGTLTLGANITTTGNVTLVSGMTFTPSTYTWNMGNATIDSGGKAFYSWRPEIYDCTRDEVILATFVHDLDKLDRYVPCTDEWKKKKFIVDIVEVKQESIDVCPSIICKDCKKVDDQVIW